MVWNEWPVSFDISVPLGKYVLAFCGIKGENKVQRCNLTT